jgi:hypothetical protein
MGIGVSQRELSRKIDNRKRSRQLRVYFSAINFSAHSSRIVFLTSHAVVISFQALIWPKLAPGSYSYLEYFLARNTQSNDRHFSALCFWAERLMAER